MRVRAENGDTMSTEHDYRSENLRGKRLRGLDLEAADFTGADLRGTDFGGAHLAGATLHDARLGVAPSVGALLIVGALLVSVAAGVLAGEGIDAIRERLYGQDWEQSTGAVGIVTVILSFMVVLFWKGFDAAVKVFLAVYVLVVGVSAAIQLIWGDLDVSVGLRGVGLVILLAMAIVAGILGRLVGGTFGAWAIALVAVPGGIAAGRVQGGAAALVVSIALVVISKRALHFDRRDRLLRLVAHRLVRRWGTRFAGADLTGADFTGTDANQCNVADAVLDGVHWEPGHLQLSIEPETVTGESS